MFPVRNLQVDDGDDDGLGSLQSSNELESFFNIMLTFVLIGLLLGVSCACVRRTLGHTTVDGAFTSTTWSFAVRALLTLAIMILVVLPVFVAVVSAAFGCVLAAGEHWSLPLGIAYVLSNVLGLQEPLTTVNPEGTLGLMIGIIVSVYALVCTATIMGIASAVCLMQELHKLLPGSFGGFLRCLTLYLPGAILSLCCLVGGVLSAIEGWSFLDGFYFMAGAMAELANPIVNVGPSTAEGCFFEAICLCIDLCMCGAVIGTISNHPQVERFVKWVSGSDLVIELEQLKQRAAELEVRIAECKLRKELVQPEKMVDDLIEDSATSTACCTEWQLRIAELSSSMNSNV